MALRQDIFAKSPELCKAFQIKRLSLFGSVARGMDSQASDIDFLAEFDDPRPDTMPDRYFGFIEAASKRFNRPVQVLTPSMIRNPFFKRSVEKDLVVVYE